MLLLLVRSGSNTLIHLVKKYPTVRFINYDSLEYCACLKNLEEIEAMPNYKFVHGDITNAELVRYIYATECIDTVIHFAAQTHVVRLTGFDLAAPAHSLTAGLEVLACTALRCVA